MTFIASNQATCRKCGDTIWSANRHDVKYCSCGAIFVDGGSAYLRRGGDLKAIKEESITIDTDIAEALLEKARELPLAQDVTIVTEMIKVINRLGYTEFTDFLIFQHDESQNVTVNGVKMMKIFSEVFDREARKRVNTNNWGLMLAAFRDMRDFMHFKPTDFARLNKEAEREAMTPAERAHHAN